MKIKLLLLCATILIFAIIPYSLLFAQEDVTITGDEALLEADLEADLEAEPEVKISAKMPVQNTKLIFIEGEQAVSTNFNKQPILNYGASGKRTLQLNRTKGLQGGAPFYADFVFYIDEPGTYELWYGGTPSGPADELYPSFVSPFKYVIDNSEEKRQAYREDIAVVENYTPSYYWNQVSELEFEPGKHQIRFEVNEKRRHDGKFYFYLDCFFFVKIEDDRRVTGDILPELFPEDMDDRRLDFPFRAIDDYLIIIRDNPENIGPYVELALIYSLLSDYLNAIKYLKRVTILDSENLDYLLLLAKNYIWKGELDTGLDLYKQLLEKDPTKKDIWMEAGKVAAWTARYDASIEFFEKGLSYFPDDLDLTVNLGLTKMWLGLRNDADRLFAKATSTAGSEVNQIKELASVFEVNGYPLKAAATYRSGIKKIPEDLELYLLLEEAYFNNGMKNMAGKVKTLINKTFLPSEDLDKFVGTFHEKMTLKEAVIEEYKRRLAENPDDLEQREMLAQAYFWNGLKDESIDEYFNILSNHSYRIILEMEQNVFPLMKMLDKYYIYNDYIDTAAARFGEKRRAISLQLNAYKKAVKNNEAYILKKQKAEETGKTLPASSIDPQTLVRETGDALASQLADVEEMIFRYDEIIGDFQADMKEVVRLNDQDRKDEEIFGKITSLINWKWNRSRFIREQEMVASKNGLVLANHVLGKIYQVEKRYGEAQAKYANVSESLTYPALEYSYFQTLLWGGQIPMALEYYDKPGSQISEYAFYTGEVKTLLLSYQQEFLETPGILGDDPAADSLSAVEGLVEKVKDMGNQKKLVQDSLKSLHLILSNILIRTLYQFEENTYLLRNELGDSLLVSEKLSEAIEQYTLVLAIDPWDISAIYRLGTVYQWNNDWHKAMQYFKKVYYNDPNYENTTALFNNIAREHADHISFETSYRTDSSSITWEGLGQFKTELNGAFGVDFRYKINNIQNYQVWKTYEYINNNYQTHDLLLGIPITISAINFSLAPFVGCAYILNDNSATSVSYNSTTVIDGENVDLYTISDPFVNTSVSSEGFFNLGELHPYVMGDYSIGRYPELMISGTLRYGKYEPTYALGRTRLEAFTGDMNIATDFSYTNISFIKNISLRAHGSIDSITDPKLPVTYANRNNIWGVSGELNINLLRITEPWSTLNMYGTAIYQDSTVSPTDHNIAALEYFTPHQSFSAGGGFTGSSYFNLAEGHVLGGNLLVAAGYNDSIDPYNNNSLNKNFKIEVSGGLEYSKGNGTISLGSAFDYQMDLASNRWGSWNFAAKIGYFSSLPGLLTQ